MTVQHTPGQWLSAKQKLICVRCTETIAQRRRYFATTTACYCAWCAGEVWGITSHQKRKS